MSNDDAVQRDPSTNGVGHSSARDERNVWRARDAAARVGSGARNVGSGTGDVLALEVRVLRYRVEHLERIMVSAFCVLTAGLLIAGAVLPMFVDSPDSEEESAISVGSIVGDSLAMMTGAERSYTDSPGVEAAFVIGFLGLTVIVAAIVLFVLPTTVAGQMTRRKLRLSRILVGLGIVGSAVPVLLSMTAISADDSAPGWGGVVLCLGMVSSAVVVLSSFQRWSDPDVELV